VKRKPIIEALLSLHCKNVAQDEFILAGKNGISRRKAIHRGN
jgi:hypothetical protein